MKNQVQLITYGNRLGLDPHELLALLRGPLSGAFSAVHVLPADAVAAGFFPVDRTLMNPQPEIRMYDFALAPLILHAFGFGTAHHLKTWIAIRPDDAHTVLDTQDGIDARAGRHGLVPHDEIAALIERVHRLTGEHSRAAGAATASAAAFDQIHCTFFDALGRDERRYLLARALQFFMPGIPQVYYVGLLAGGNDVELLARTGRAPDINRHQYTRTELDVALARPVVRDLIRLMQFRNTHGAFAGEFALLETVRGKLAMRWARGAHYAELTIDLSAAGYELLFSTAHGPERFRFVSAEPLPLERINI